MAITKATSDVIKDGELTEAKLVAGSSASPDNISLLGFKLATADSLAIFNMKDGIIDDYNDATGIDTSASTNDTRDSTSKYYSGTVVGGATGGTVTTSGIYRIHTFTSSGTFVVSAGSGDVEYLVIGGGGGGGGRLAGGGGAGGFRTNVSGAPSGGGGSAEATHNISAGNHTVTIGAGGLGSLTNNHGSNQGLSGEDSVFGTITSDGGGGGQGTVSSALSGGSGGGGLYPDTFGTGTANQGYNGGDGVGASNGSGGGGGAGGIGEDGAAADGGNGGAGLASSISGSAVTYAGGGGGGVWTSGSSGSGGSGGGGPAAPANSGAKGTAGTVNTGSGGGGGCTDAAPNAGGGNGGSGLVVVRYVDASGFSTYNNMTLISNAQTATSAPSNGRVCMLMDPATGTTTINTDIKAYVSRDNGTTYSQVTLVDEGTYAGTQKILAGTVDVSGQPSGTSMRYKIETLNQGASKVTRIYGTSLSW